MATLTRKEYNMNYNFLKGKIVEKCGSQSKFAELLGITPQELTKKLSNKASFTQSQMFKSKEILGLNDSEVVKAFLMSN
jgi:plasmid maintenance system antidote protein VapI